MRLAIRGEILTFLLGKIDGLYLRFLQLHQKLLLEGLDSPFQILDLAEDSRSQDCENPQRDPGSR